ncbi:MAG: amidohydrolase [Saonia sp.]
MSKELKIALIQSPLVWENPERNRSNFSEKINGIPSDVDLIVLPEMFNTGFTMTPHNIEKEEGAKTLDWMIQRAEEKNSAIVGSIPFFKDGAYTNRLFFVKPGKRYFFYDKRHTFTLAGEDKVYKAGNEKLIVDYKGFKICPLICYDLRFPVWARNTENYDILLYVANWPKPRINAWDTLLSARAIENMAYCIGLNRVGQDGLGHEYSGHSAIYDVLGKPLVFSKEETILYASLNKEHITHTRNKLKFLEDRDHFNLVE